MNSEFHFHFVMICFSKDQLILRLVTSNSNWGNFVERTFTVHLCCASIPRQHLSDGEVKIWFLFLLKTCKDHSGVFSIPTIAQAKC
jgi:hypothetical protein